MKEYPSRKCNRTCEFYNPATRRCAIYDSVKEQKRKIIYSTVAEGSPCRFGLGKEEDTAMITKSGLLEIISRFSDGFREKITQEDINITKLQLF